MTKEIHGNLVSNQSLIKLLKWYLANPFKGVPTHWEDRYSFRDLAYTHEYIRVAKTAKYPLAFRKNLMELAGTSGALSDRNVVDIDIRTLSGYELKLSKFAKGMDYDTISSEWSTKRYLKYLKTQKIVPWSVPLKLINQHNEHFEKTAKALNKKMVKCYEQTKHHIGQMIDAREKHLHQHFWLKKMLHVGNDDIDAINGLKRTAKAIHQHLRDYLRTDGPKNPNAQFGVDYNYDSMREDFGFGQISDDELDVFNVQIIGKHFVRKDTASPVDLSPSARLAVYANYKSKQIYIHKKYLKPVPCLNGDATVDNIEDIMANQPGHPLTNPRVMVDYKRFVLGKKKQA